MRWVIRARRILPSSIWSCRRARGCRDIGPAQALLPLCLLAQPGAARFLQGDLGPVGLGGVVGAAEIEVHDPVDAPGRRRSATAARAPDTATRAIARIALEAVSDTLKHVWGDWLGEVAERTGLEPATPGVTGRYSNQLNYRSEFWGANVNGLMNKATSSLPFGRARPRDMPCARRRPAARPGPERTSAGDGTR